MPSLWIRQQWNAEWACRRCLVHIWNIAPGVLDRILDHYSDQVYPAIPTLRQATAEAPEDSHNYDMSTHLSPGSRAPVEDTDATVPPRED
eukprot:5612188-Pyramimonas_sp.AAC.1